MYFRRYLFTVGLLAVVALMLLTAGKEEPAEASPTPLASLASINSYPAPCVKDAQVVNYGPKLKSGCHIDKPHKRDPHDCHRPRRNHPILCAVGRVLRFLFRRC